MELPVHTGLLRLERRLYQVGRLELPRSVSLVEAGVFLGVLVLLVLATRAVHLGVSPGWAFLYLLLPYGAAHLASQPVADQKPIHLWALSQLRYFLVEPAVLARLAPVAEARRARVRLSVAGPRPAAALPVAPPRRQALPEPEVDHPLRAMAALRLEVVEPVEPAPERRPYALPPRSLARAALVPFATLAGSLTLICLALGVVLAVVFHGREV